MSTAVAELESLLQGHPETPLRPNQVRAAQEESRRVEAILDAPKWVTADRKTAYTRKRQLDEMLATQAPKAVNPALRDRVAKLTQEVLAQDIVPTLQPRSVMRRNPPGAVERFLKGENAPPTKRAICAWKRARWALEPEADSQDHTNLEVYRPEGAGEGAATMMADAQIPGHFAMTPAAKANWPLGEPTAKTAIAHLQPAAESRDFRETPTALAPEEKILCACGCGKAFLPRTRQERYINKAHRSRACKLRQKRRAPLLDMTSDPIPAPVAPEEAPPAAETQEA